MTIKKGDTVKIISGKDRGKQGKVTRVFPDRQRVVVEGVNICKKNMRPKKQGQKGQIIQISAPIYASTAMVVCPSCGKTVRVGNKKGNKKSGEKKIRVCKKCGADIA